MTFFSPLCSRISSSLVHRPEPGFSARSSERIIRLRFLYPINKEGTDIYWISGLPKVRVRKCIDRSLKILSFAVANSSFKLTFPLHRKVARMPLS